MVARLLHISTRISWLQLYGFFPSSELQFVENRRVRVWEGTAGSRESNVKQESIVNSFVTFTFILAAPFTCQSRRKASKNSSRLRFSIPGENGERVMVQNSTLPWEKCSNCEMSPQSRLIFPSPVLILSNVACETMSSFPDRVSSRELRQTREPRSGQILLEFTLGKGHAMMSFFQNFQYKR